MDLKKNDEIAVLIDGLTSDGEGVAHIDGFPFFIKDTVPGDRVKAVVTKLKRNLGYARLLSVEEPSPDRIKPFCPVARSCGGCTLQHMSYEAELNYKESKVYNALLRIGGIPPEVLESASEPIEGMQKVFRYRNKAQYPVGVNKEGKAVAGFYSGRTHHIVEEEDCALLPEEFGVILRSVLDFIDEFRVQVYDELSHKGLIRHVLVRKGFNTGEIMVCIVSASGNIPNAQILASRLLRISGVRSVCLNINPDRTNVILGKKCVSLAGPMYIEDELCGLRFRISPLSFYQVNPVMAEKLYLKAMEYAGFNRDEGAANNAVGNGAFEDAPAALSSDGSLSQQYPREVWDLCCGIGTITLTAASFLLDARLHGIEIVPEAIEDARINAALNHISNVDFTAAAAEDYLPVYMADHPGAKADVVIADPPRKGLKKETLDAILSLSPERIVYISCDSATLARDLRILMSGGYALKKYQVFDQFSRTSHVETVVLLTKQNT